MLAILIAAAIATADDCPAIGRAIEGPMLTEAPIYDPATQTAVGKVIIVKGQVTPNLVIEGCSGRYFITHLDGRRVVIPRKSVSYHGSITTTEGICIKNAGGASAAQQDLAGAHAMDRVQCSDKGATGQ